MPAHARHKEAKRFRDQKKIALMQDCHKALQLRLAGHTYQVIGEVMGLAHRGTAHTLVKLAMQEIVNESAEMLVKMDLARLDSMYAAIAPKVRAGDVQALDRAIKILERRAHMLGLDAAIKQDVGGTVEFQFRIDKAGKHAVQRPAELTE